MIKAMQRVVERWTTGPVRRRVTPGRSTVQLGLSISGAAAFCVAGLLVHTVIGVVVLGLACWFVERRISS